MEIPYLKSPHGFHSLKGKTLSNRFHHLITAPSFTVHRFTLSVLHSSAFGNRRNSSNNFWLWSAEIVISLAKPISSCSLIHSSLRSSACHLLSAVLYYQPAARGQSWTTLQCAAGADWAQCRDLAGYSHALSTRSSKCRRRSRPQSIPWRPNWWPRRRSHKQRSNAKRSATGPPLDDGHRRTPTHLRR